MGEYLKPFITEELDNELINKLKRQLKMDRKNVLLKAALELLQQQEKSHYVLNLLSETVHYDEVDCDGYCLMEDIKAELEENKEFTIPTFEEFRKLYHDNSMSHEASDFYYYFTGKWS